VIEVRVDDLAFFDGDAIVRPVTAELQATTALMRRLETAAGPKLIDQLQVQEPLPVGAAIVTGAGELETELLVHAVVSSREERVTRQTVRQALASALHRVEAWQLEHIAIAPLGLGAGNLTIEDSADAMVDVLATHLRRSRFPSRVTIIAETSDERAIVAAAVDRSGL
jgi:O-acetyl-ADP-ribose deacetylase (regulator of RNase III)